MQRISHPNAVMLSLSAEPQKLFRHRKLGYSLCLRDFRLRELGNNLHDWLRENFETVPHDPDDVKYDYLKLIDVARKNSPLQFLVLNLLSSSGYEDVSNYMQFDRPMSRTVWSIYAREIISCFAIWRETRT